MIITQHMFGLSDIKGISIKIMRNDAVGYMTTIKLECANGQTQMVSVSSDNLEALVPTIEVCPACNAELYEKEMVASGNNLPMANPNVDEYENLPF